VGDEVYAAAVLVVLGGVADDGQARGLVVDEDAETVRVRPAGEEGDGVVQPLSAQALMALVTASEVNRAAASASSCLPDTARRVRTVSSRALANLLHAVRAGSLNP
jgi:hypothetical protein